MDKEILKTSYNYDTAAKFDQMFYEQLNVSHIFNYTEFLEYLNWIGHYKKVKDKTFYIDEKEMQKFYSELKTRLFISSFLVLITISTLIFNLIRIYL